MPKKHCTRYECRFAFFGCFVGLSTAPSKQTAFSFGISIVFLEFLRFLSTYVTRYFYFELWVVQQNVSDKFLAQTNPQKKAIRFMRPAIVVTATFNSISYPQSQNEQWFCWISYDGIPRGTVSTYVCQEICVFFLMIFLHGKYTFILFY